MLKRILNKLGIYKLYATKIAGKTFKIPIYDGLGFANFADSEPWMDELLQEFGTQDTTFLDVGMNVGQTLLKWKALYPASNYYGFEPNENCVKYVNDLIEKNKISNTHIYPYALDIVSAKKKLFLLGRDKADSSASMIKNFRADESRTELDIETTSLKSLGLSDFDLIKIDVEGAELFVLKSLFEVCQNGIILCEILPVYKAANVARLNRQIEIERLLKSFNYSIFRVIKSTPIELIEIKEFGIHSELSKSDYVFIPSHKIGQHKNLID